MITSLFAVDVYVHKCVNGRVFVAIMNNALIADKNFARFEVFPIQFLATLIFQFQRFYESIII